MGILDGIMSLAGNAGIGLSNAMGAFEQNGGMAGVAQNPYLQLGLQLMARGGKQGGLVQTLGQAGLAASGAAQQAQQQQSIQAYRDAMVKQQQAVLQRQQQQDALLQQQRQVMQQPNFLDQLSPAAKAMAGSGAFGIDDVLGAQRSELLNDYRQQQLQLQDRAQDRLDARANQPGASGPRMGAMRQFVDKPLEGGLMQRYQLNPQTGQYDTFGDPFSPHAQRGAIPGATPGINAGAGASGADAKAASLVGQILGTGGQAAVPPTAQAPVAVGGQPLAQAGMGNLQSYAPKTGAALLTAAGSVQDKGATLPGAGQGANQALAILQQARQAIQRGADPQAVAQRLRSMGLDPAQLGM